MHGAEQGQNKVEHKALYIICCTLYFTSGWIWPAGRLLGFGAVEGLNLKPSEELELLIKWLGGEPLQHAKRIRAVHINNPSMGWTCFGRLLYVWLSGGN